MRIASMILLLIGGSVVNLPMSTVADAEQATSSVVVRIQLRNEPITPVTAQFVVRAIKEAEQQQAKCLLVELDTPGGLVDSTQRIVKDILASRVPVVVYVSPSGSRAASAGLFITLSSHVAAMAPGTRIGAAHPVQIGASPIAPGKSPALPEREQPSKDDPDGAKATRSTMEDKLINDMVAWARSLAQLRGRNAEWVVLAVSESSSITASEAVQEGVVDLEAADLADLLRQIDGREITLQSSAGVQQNVRLSTAGSPIHTLEMWWGERLLAVLADPNLALVLMMVGVYGVLYELYSPGWGVGGTLGVICLVLGFFALSVLPINYAGLALIALALGLFVAEAFVASFGVLTVSGIVCLILGGTMLVDSPTGFMQVSLTLLIPIAVATGLITVFLITGVVQAQRGPVQTGGESMLGTSAVVRADFALNGDQYCGQVFVHGEIWNARSSLPVASGQHVQVKDLQGLTLQVATQSECEKESPRGSTLRGESSSNRTINK